MAFIGKHFSHYRILRIIGKGGMGEVYLVEDSRVQQQVAAKFIRLDQVQENQPSAPDALRLFWREATAIAQFDHPAILPLYDHEEAVIDEVTVAYLIMPYRSEGSLSAWLRHRAQHQKTRQLTLKQVEHVIQQAAQGLQHAHDHQVVHLDVKPANFLIRSRQDSDDYPDLLLADFGIARLTNGTSSASQYARGTPTYMAPEQWASQPAFASDQYALAIMAYELLAGQPPFQGAPLSVMYAHIQQQPRSVRDHNSLVPPAVDLVLQRALAKHPQERFSSVATFAQAFQMAFADMDASTSLRVLRPASGSSSTPPSRPPEATSVTGDRHATLSISVQEAREGTLRTLNLPNGRIISVQIPAGAQTNQVLILVGQGETPMPGAAPGNLSLTLQVVEAFEQMAAVTDYAVPTGRGFSAVEAVPSVQAVAPTQETTTSPPYASDDIVLTHGPAPLSPHMPAQGLIPPESSRTSPAQPLPLFVRRDRKPRGIRVGHMVLILLVLGLLTLGLYGAVTGPWFRPGPATISLGSEPGLKTIRLAHSGTSQELLGVTWSGSQFVAVGAKGTILTSPDGSTWTTQNAGISIDYLPGVTWSGSQFVAVGDKGTILTSPDGRTWTPRTSGTSQELYSVTWSGSQLVAVGFHGTILTSPDGRTWTPRTSDTSQDLYSVAWSSSQFVVVGNSGTILTSPDGRTWTPRTPRTSQALNSLEGALPLEGVTWSGSQFVAVGDRGTILTSPDGRTWTPQASQTSRDLRGVVWAGSQFVVVGGSGAIVTSPDGRTWTLQISEAGQFLTHVAWSGSQLVAVGSNGTILTSP